MPVVNRISRGEIAVGGIVGSTGDVNYGLDFGTASVDPASIPTVSRGSVTFTLTGAKTTDIIIVNPPADLNDDLIFCGAAISAADTVSIYLYNPTGSAINDTARTFSYVWIDMTA
jgi:sarcosine oxidase gamma subunit